MKKRVKFLVAIAGGEFSYLPKDEADIDVKLADAWIASGVCIAAPLPVGAEVSRKDKDKIAVGV